jgi:hypothetical protein
VRFHSIRWIIVTLMFVLASLACQLLTPRGSEERSKKILFQDDFTDPRSGWNQVITTSGETTYADGMYRIFVNGPNLDIWARPGRNLTDVRIEVDTYKVGGDRNNRFGLICRITGSGNFYTFLISSDGYYGIGKVKNKAYELIGKDSLEHSDAIQLGSAPNHIRADCVGDTLTLYINGQKLAEVKDNSFTSGDVGLIAGTYDIPGTDIRFDNFTVYEP